MDIDTAKIAELKELMGEDFALLINSYIDDNLLLLEQLQENIGNNVEADIRKAHSIKSTSLNLGAVATAELASQMEQRLKNGQPLTEADWLSLSQQLQKTVTQLREMVS